MIRVLIVDDDHVTLDALTEALTLRISEAQIDTCESAASALEKLAEQNYDTIISDVKMPGMDGIQMLRYARDLATDIPVMLITGHGETGLAIQALRAGAFDLVQKPIDRDYLVAGVLRAVETRRLRQEVQEKQRELERHAEELEQRVEEKTAELRTALQTKDEFLGLISHELRTPVAVIYGNIEMLHRRADKLSEDAKATALADVRQEAHRLLRVIENLLVLARLQYKAVEKPSPLAVSNLIQQQVGHHRQRYSYRELRLELPEERPTVLADEAHIEMVLGNLLSNAEKYSPPSQPIEVNMVQDGAEVVITVSDRGPGVPPEEAQQIFEPFYRSASTSDTALGIGVGLSVCKRLVELNDGRVWVEARAGGGSNFRLALPIAPTSPDSLPIYEVGAREPLV